MNTPNYRHRRRETGRIWGGLFLLLAGTALILHQEGLLIPNDLYNWHLLLAGLGLFIGFARNFRGGAWLVLMAIGGFGLAQDFYPTMHIEAFLWPCVIILFGLVLLFRRRRPCEAQWEARWEERKRHWRDSREFAHTEQVTSAEDFVDMTYTFGQNRKKILSKNFRGGHVVTFMGQTEIDLSEADIQGTVKLEATQIMGRSIIVVPPDVEVRSDVHAVFAGFEDKREEPAVANPGKVLVIIGTSVFAGLEVRSRAVSVD